VMEEGAAILDLIVPGARRVAEPSGRGGGIGLGKTSITGPIGIEATLSGGPVHVAIAGFTGTAGTGGGGGERTGVLENSSPSAIHIAGTLGRVGASTSEVGTKDQAVS